MATLQAVLLKTVRDVYIIKMVENNSTEKYDSECSSAISEKEEEVFHGRRSNSLKQTSMLLKLTMMNGIR